MSASSDPEITGDPGPANPTPGRVYLDHASTSPLRPEAAEAMLRWLSAADPGRVHTEGRMAREALEDARASVAGLFGTRSRQVIFTSGATEAINAACFGALMEPEPSTGRPTAQGRVAAVAGVEHSAVREATDRWAVEARLIQVDREGRIDVDHLASLLSQDSVSLVHCQWANHEVGTVQPVRQVVEMCRESGVMVHVDAATAAGRVPIDFAALGADLLSVSAHKLGGPRGIGALLVRRGLRIPPLILGGSQERARRGGLEDVAAAAGFGAAAAHLAGSQPDEARAAREQTDRLRTALQKVGGLTFYGPADPGGRLPHLLCLGVEGVEAEAVLIGLDQAGVAAHSGSACSSESLEPSPVLEAMGVDADHSLRLSVGWSTTDADIETVIGVLPEVVRRLRLLRS